MVTGTALCSGFGAFLRNTAGSVGITFAIAALPIFAVAGVATDFVRASTIEARLQSTLDAAALAAAASKKMGDQERIAFAKALFQRNWQADPSTRTLDVLPTFEVSEGTITGSASLVMETSIMRVLGIETMEVGGEVAVTIPGEKKAEIALVLDYSSSMEEEAGGEVKYIAMRNAALKLVEDLSELGADKLKIGLVPFSDHVYVSLPKEYVRGEKGTGTWTGCTLDRLYPHNRSDSTPSNKDETKWGQPGSSANPSYSCNGYSKRKLRIEPLTGDVDRLKTRIREMMPYSHTHIALGVEFGFHLLSPNAPFTNGAAYDDESTRKFMVVLTDGRQTENAFGRTSRNPVQGERNLVSLCEAAKDRGITMITIAYDLRDEATEDRLRDCASDPSRSFFVAENDDQIASAFQEITAQITAQVFLSK